MDDSKTDGKVGQIVDLTRALDSPRAEVSCNVCDACGGTGKPISGLNCMCEGTGMMSRAAVTLREELVALRAITEQDKKNLDALRAEVASLTAVNRTVCEVNDKWEADNKALREEVWRLRRDLHEQRLDLAERSRMETAHLRQSYEAVVNAASMREALTPRTFVLKDDSPQRARLVAAARAVVGKSVMIDQIDPAQDYAWTMTVPGTLLRELHEAAKGVEVSK